MERGGVVSAWGGWASGFACQGCLKNWVGIFKFACRPFSGSGCMCNRHSPCKPQGMQKGVQLERQKVLAVTLGVAVLGAILGDSAPAQKRRMQLAQ